MQFLSSALGGLKATASTRRPGDSLLDVQFLCGRLGAGCAGGRLSAVRTPPVTEARPAPRAVSAGPWLSGSCTAPVSKMLIRKLLIHESSMSLLVQLIL